MTGQMTAKIRLVICPRCRHLLEEPEIPVYKCGGCGTVLQAKNRKTGTKDTGLSCDDTDENRKRELDSVTDQKEISNPNQGATTGAGEEESPDTSNNRHHDDFQDCSGKQPGDENFCHKLSSSLEPTCRENEDSSPEVREQIEQVSYKYNPDQNANKCENEFGNFERNWSRDRSFSDAYYSSMEFPCHETGDSSPELQANIVSCESKSISDQCAGVDQTEHEDSIREQHEDSNLLSKVSSLKEDKHDENDFSPKDGAPVEGDGNKCLSQHVGSSNECMFEGHSGEFLKNANSFREISLSTEIVPEKPSPVVEANAEVEEDLRRHTYDSLKTEDTLDKNETDSVDGAENPIDESIPSDIVDSPDDQELGVSRQKIPRGFGHASSVDTLNNLPLVNSSSELGLKQINLSKSPTKSYYACDGIASSSDGYGDRIPGRSSKPPKRKFKHANLNNSNGLHREDGPPAKDNVSSNLEMQYRSGLHEMLSSESEVRHQASQSSILPEKNHPTTKYRNHHADLRDPRSNGHYIGSRIREDKDEHVSELPFIPNYSLSGHRKENPSPYPYNMFQYYSGFRSPDAPSFTEPDKLQLLRMVHELKDELNRMHISNSRFPPRVTREENSTPLFCDHHVAPVEGISSDLRYSRYPGRYSQAKGLPQLHNLSRMAFSGDAADYRRHADHAYLHCRPQDWHCSEQLPSHMICCNKVHCMAHTSTCYNGPCSTSSSPNRYKSSEFSVWDRETKSHDLRHRDNEMKKLHVRERYQSTKRHLMPVAGGTPIVACYHCSELLQLPADFLLLGRRCHKLRCNACRKIMKFSLQSSTHLVPFVPDAVAPPPSMVDDCSESIRQRNWASTSHSIDNPYAEPLSCTDDYGMSFDQSCSTEGEPLLITPQLHPVERNSQNRKISSGNSVMPLEDRKLKSPLQEFQKMHRNSVDNIGSLGPLSKRSNSRKSSSEIKELPTTGGSPLHRLMGYSSPSAVMKN